MTDLTVETTNYIVTVNSTPNYVAVVQPETYSVVIDNSRIGPAGPAGETGLANVISQYTWLNTHTFSNTVSITRILANGSLGTASQVLHTNGSSIYWATDDNSGGTVSSIITGDGLSGGPITTNGTVSVLANTGIIANTNGIFVNASYISTLSSNNSAFVGSNSASDLRSYSESMAGNAYSNAVSYVDGKFFVNTSQLSTNLANYQTVSGLSSNVAVLTSNNTNYFDGQLPTYYATSANPTLTGNVTINNILKVQDSVHEVFQTIVDATGVVTHDCSSGHIFYHTSPDGNWTANFTNLNLTNGYATTMTLVIAQGGTGYYANAVQIGGVSQTVNWQANTLPSPNANRIDVVTFSVLNNSNTYTVLGQLTGF